MHFSRSFRTLKLASGQISQPFLTAIFFLCGPTLQKLFQESEMALLTSDREVKCTCVNSNCQKSQSNYLLNYFYTSHFDHVPFFMVSFIVFWFVLVYIYLLHISLFKKSSNLSLLKKNMVSVCWCGTSVTSQKLPFQCSISVVGAGFVVFQPSTVEHLPSQWSHPKYLQTSCSRRLCSAVYHVYHYCC